MNERPAAGPMIGIQDEPHEDVQEVRVSCESCGALLSVSSFLPCIDQTAKRRSLTAVTFMPTCLYGIVLI